MKNIIDKLKPLLKPKDIDENNKEQKDIDVEKNNDEVELRIKKNLFDGMIKKFQHSIERFQEVHNEIKNTRETKLVRGAEIALGMVVELNLLVQYQGEMIDNIVINIKNAKDYIDKGNVMIDKGNKCMQCKKRIKCIIMIVVIAILLIILIPIIVKFAK